MKMNKIKLVIELVFKILPYIDDIIDLLELIIKSFKENGKPTTEKAIKQSINKFKKLENGTN